MNIERSGEKIETTVKRWLIVIVSAVLIVVIVWGLGWTGQAKSEEAQQGLQALGTYGCRSCHTIPGVQQADGIIGPPLDFWGSRWYIAGALVNSPENLVQWLMHPQAIEPGTVMPEMGVTEIDALNIGAYLFTLQIAEREPVSHRGHTGEHIPVTTTTAGGSHDH
jgi:cytochrome c